MKKKRVNKPIGNEGTVTRTVDDYEIVRHIIVEGGELANDIERDLAGLIGRGVAMWLYQKRGPQNIEYTKPLRPQKGQPAENLTVLLANMMES